MILEATAIYGRQAVLEIVGDDLDQLSAGQFGGSHYALSM
jgi:hypothetical protein